MQNVLAILTKTLQYADAQTNVEKFSNSYCCAKRIYNINQGQGEGGQRLNLVV